MNIDRHMYERSTKCPVSYEIVSFSGNCTKTTGTVTPVSL
jgi:hypothetical protein